MADGGWSCMLGDRFKKLIEMREEKPRVWVESSEKLFIPGTYFSAFHRSKKALELVLDIFDLDLGLISGILASTRPIFTGSLGNLSLTEKTFTRLGLRRNLNRGQSWKDELLTWLKTFARRNFCNLFNLLQYKSLNNQTSSEPKLGVLGLSQNPRR